MNPDDSKLQKLLREARVSPVLPPRLRENVWRRIEDADARAGDEIGWLNALAVLLLRPRFAYATALVLVMAGAVLGAHAGSQVARHDAEARYVALVAPN